MERAVLVTEAQSPLGASLVRLLLGRGLRVAAAVDASSRSGEGGWPADYRLKPFLSLQWNRRSPVSAHALVASALASFGGLDDALVLEPPSPQAGAGSMASADIDRALDDLKGPAFLVRELHASLSARGSGVLCFVSPWPRAADEAGPPLQQVVHEGFRGLAGALIPAGAGSPLLVSGFQAFGVEPGEFAQFIDRTLDEKARKTGGRWFTAGAGLLHRGAAPRTRS
jgi:NAD(P)-dependent dehydrogenase (short-subunit alcohol dehydrogenase family)